MTISEKIKTIYSKTEKNKAQYDSDRQTAKISALSSGSVRKHDFLTGKDGLLKKKLARKVATIKRFGYSTLGSELKSKLTLQKNSTKD